MGNSCHPDVLVWKKVHSLQNKMVNSFLDQESFITSCHNAHEGWLQQVWTTFIVLEMHIPPPLTHSHRTQGARRLAGSVPRQGAGGATQDHAHSQDTWADTGRLFPVRRLRLQCYLRFSAEVPQAFEFLLCWGNPWAGPGHSTPTSLSFYWGAKREPGRVSLYLIAIARAFQTLFNL